MTHKIFFLILGITSILNASCTYDLNVDFDFKNRSIDVKANVYDKEKSLQLDLLDFDIKNRDDLKESLNNGSNNAVFSYRKNIKNLNKDYIYLLDNWYPNSKNRCQYNITTTLEASYKKVYENTNKQIDHATFVASRKFVVNSQKYNHINIQTYFLKEQKELSSKYINKSIEYIKLYENLVGIYPYKEFKVVENIYGVDGFESAKLMGAKINALRSKIKVKGLGNNYIKISYSDSNANDTYKIVNSVIRWAKI